MPRTARDHARFASELLGGVDNRLAAIQDLTDEQHLQMIVSGGIKRSNADVEFTIELAHAHAATALALAAVETVDEGLDRQPSGDEPHDR